MDIEQARATALEHRQVTPEQFETQLETLFINPYFGDVITQVFPEVLDIHNRDGRNLLEKYSAVAQFLDETKDTEDAKFLALRVETQNNSWDGRGRMQGIRALSVRWYEGLQAENFEVAKTPNGKAIGIAIMRDAEVRAGGWQEGLIEGRQPYAVVDSALSSIRFTAWSGLPDELSSQGQFVFGSNYGEVRDRIGAVEHAYGLSLQPIRGIVSDMQRDMLTRNA